MLVTALSVALSAMLDTLQEAFARPPHPAHPECSSRQHGGSRALRQARRRPRRASAGHHRDAAGVVDPVEKQAHPAAVEVLVDGSSRALPEAVVIDDEDAARADPWQEVDELVVG